MASQPYLGAIFMFGGNFAPRGYALCQGQLLSISANAALFAILGTTFGGNGTTTFGLPDLQGRVPVGTGTGPGLSTYVLGETTGSENVTLAINQIPSHNHSLVAVNATAANASTPSGNLPGSIPVPRGQTSATSIYSHGVSSDSTMAANAIGNTGGNLSHSNIQPVLAINYIIATVGIFPSRN